MGTDLYDKLQYYDSSITLCHTMVVNNQKKA